MVETTTYPWQMLSQMFVFRKSKNFTSDNGIRMPPTTPLNHYSGQSPIVNLADSESQTLFNCNNLNIRYWSWNYRGCWHQTCPPMDPR
eukprot:XP_001698950.1 predicted protein [Chlamydomonas reinhardtii]